ncbi:MAG: hypothetical protein ACLQF0_05480 [Dissulfurispiraceae bacterium]
MKKFRAWFSDGTYYDVEASCKEIAAIVAAKNKEEVSGIKPGYADILKVSNTFMETCAVCGRKTKYPMVIKQIVTFIVNYQAMDAKEFPAGSLICRREIRKLNTVGGGALSKDKAISYRNGKYETEDGRIVL